MHYSPGNNAKRHSKARFRETLGQTKGPSVVRDPWIAHGQRGPTKRDRKNAGKLSGCLNRGGSTKRDRKNVGKLPSCLDRGGSTKRDQKNAGKLPGCLDRGGSTKRDRKTTENRQAARTELLPQAGTRIWEVTRPPSLSTDGADLGAARAEGFHKTRSQKR